jgi:hypothetical protein
MPRSRPAATTAEVSVPSQPPYARRLTDSYPRSGRRDNSFMPRRPYTGVAPAQSVTQVASTSTSAGATLGMHHLRMATSFGRVSTLSLR